MLRAYVSEQCSERLFGNRRARADVVAAGFLDEALDVAATGAALHHPAARAVDLAGPFRSRQHGLADVLIGEGIAKADIHTVASHAENANRSQFWRHLRAGRRKVKRKAFAPLDKSGARRLNCAMRAYSDAD